MSIPNTASSRDASWTTTVAAVMVSFGAGVATASWIYCWKAAAADAVLHQDDDNSNDNNDTNQLRRRSNNTDCDEDNDDIADKNASNNDAGRRSSLMDSSFRWMHQSVEDLTHRIGELPSLRRRGHWPWDQPKNHPHPRGGNAARKREATNHHTTTSRNDGDDNNNGTSNDSSNKNNDSNKSNNTPQSAAASNNNNNNNNNNNPDSKSPLCIGSIFGLDVGGTLAKLAYFESNELTLRAAHHEPNRAERLYRASASAQAVCLARRSSAGRSSLYPGAEDQQQQQQQPVLNHHHFSFHGETLTSSTTNTGQQRRRRQRPRSKSCSSSSQIWAPVFVSSSSETELEQQQQQEKDRSHPPRLKHSDSSNEDLQSLAKLRQESVPEDLHAFAKATGQAPLNDDDDDGDGNHKDNKHNNKDDSTTVPSQMRKVRSMFDMSSSSSCSSTNSRADHAQALDRFYNFARRLDSYREGVRDHQLSFYSHELGGEFHFIRFETRRMANAMDLIRANKLHLNIHSMGGTGGGAHKFAALWREELGIEMKKQDELDSLVAGMQFVLATVVGECYTFRPRQQQQQPAQNGTPTMSVPSTPNNDSGRAAAFGGQNSSTSTDKVAADKTSPDLGNEEEAPPWKCDPESMDQFQDNHHTPVTPDKRQESFDFDDEKPPIPSRTPSGESDGDHANVDEWWWSRKVQRDSISYSSTYPYLVVTIGTGVSVIRVDGPRKYERVSGSTIGGGTYLGLIRLLTDVEDFDDILRLAERGDPSKVDMLVGDIYGENSDALEKLGLPANLVASSFGKLVAKEDPAAGLKQEDLARALLFMITTNIGHVAYLNAKLMNTPRIYFVGNFLRQNLISQRRLSYAIYYWSKGEMEALFLEHEGYFGALGAFLLAQDIPSPNAAVVNGTTGSRGGTESFARHRRRSTLEHPLVTS